MLYSVRVQNLLFIHSFLFLFNFNVQLRDAPFIYITVFQEDSKWSCVVGGWVFRSVESQLFVLRLASLISVKIFRLPFSLFLLGFVMNVISIYVIIIITTIFMAITFLYMQSI